MKNKTSNLIIIIIILICFGIVIWYLYQLKSPASKTTSENQTATTSTSTSTPETNIEYKNTQYSFIVSLPLSWKNYSIVTDNWEGNLLSTTTNKTVKGPKIIVRSPLWTVENPRQDIPVMIFTLAEWDLIQQEKMSVSAAPIKPSELGRNAKYVFALPARYNFAFPTGFEEVEKIIESKPLHTF